MHHRSSFHPAIRWVLIVVVILCILGFYYGNLSHAILHTELLMGKVWQILVLTVVYTCVIRWVSYFFMRMRVNLSTRNAHVRYCFSKTTPERSCFPTSDVMLEKKQFSSHWLMVLYLRLEYLGKHFQFCLNSTRSTDVIFVQLGIFFFCVMQLDGYFWTQQRSNIEHLLF